MKNRISTYVLAAVLAAAFTVIALPAAAADTGAAETEHAAETETGLTEAGETSVTETPASGTEAFDDEAALEEIMSSTDLEMLDQFRSDDGVKAEEWLPIGSVVLLDGASKTLMVMARFVYNSNGGKYYDYCGCLYPEGFGERQYYFFNQDEIGFVASRGYEDDYEKLYREKILDRLDVSILNEEEDTEKEGDDQ